MNRTAIVSLIFLSLAIACDYWLAPRGRGEVFNAKMPEHITIDYDPLEGYRILEHGSIHVVDERMVYASDTLSEIIAYDASESAVFIKAKTRSDSVLYLQVRVLNRDKDQLEYELLQYASQGTEDWVDVSDRTRIRLIYLARTYAFAFAALSFIVFVASWVWKTLRR